MVSLAGTFPDSSSYFKAFSCSYHSSYSASSCYLASFGSSCSIFFNINKTYHVWIAHSRITHSRPYLVHHRVHHGLLVHLRKLSLHHNSIDIWCHSCLQAFVKLGNICLKLLESCILESYRSLRIFFLDSF